MGLKGRTARKLLRVTLALMTLAGLACVHDVTTGGPVKTRTYDVTDFTAVQVISSQKGTQVYHTFEVQIVPAEAYSVSVAANENLLSSIHVTRAGSTLQIELRDVQVSFAPTTLQARVTMPELLKVSASGAADVTATGFKSSHDFTLELSGGADAILDIETGNFAATISGGRAAGTVKSADAHIEVYGSGAADFSGSARDLVLQDGDGGEAALDRFSVHNADVFLAGIGTRAYLTVNGQMDVTLTGSAILTYSGNVTLGRTSISAGSILRQRP